MEPNGYIKQVKDLKVDIAKCLLYMHMIHWARELIIFISIFVLFLIKGYNFTEESVSPQKSHTDSTAITYHRIIEAWKFAYAARMNLGDDSFVDNSKVNASKIN